MKIKLPKPVRVALPNGTTVDYAARDMVDHIVRNGREFGQSREADKVRQGVRLLAAVAEGTAEQTGEVAPEDLEALKLAVARPSCGWSAIKVTIEIPVGVKPDGTELKRAQERHVVASAIELLPLIDGLLNA